MKKAARALLQGERTAQRSLSETEVEMDRKSWERRNSDIALYETNQLLESQRLELYQANGWADQAQKENSRFEWRADICPEHHARDGQEIEQIRSICCKQADRVRQLRNDEFSLQKKENPSTVNQLLSQIRELHDKVNSLIEGKEFYDLEIARSSGISHVPNQPSRIPSPRGMIRRDSGLPHNTRNSMGTSGYVFEYPSAPEGPSLCELRSGNTESAMRHGKGLRREPQSSTIPIPRLARKYWTWNPLCHTGGTSSQISMMETPRYTISELHFENSETLVTFNVGEPTSRPMCVSTPFPHNDMDQWSGDDKINRRSQDVAINLRAKKFLFIWNAWCEDCVCVENDHHKYLFSKKRSEEQRAL